MHRKKKGRKIFTYRVKNRRVFSPNHPMRKALGTVLLLVVMGFLGFVGYHVIGPVIDRIAAEKEAPTQTDDPYFTESLQTGTTAQSAVTAASTTVTKVTTVTTAAAISSAATETTALSFRLASDALVAYCISPDSLTNVGVLSAAVSTLSQRGYSALVIPLKTSGGLIRYATANPAASTAGAVVSNTLTLQEITDTVSANGMACYAMMDLLGDSIYPTAFPDGAFQMNGKPWKDADGKSWISPFSESAKSYLCSLTAEIGKADFMGLLLTNAAFPAFPAFSAKDAKAIGEKVTDEKQRRNALTSLLNATTVFAPKAALTVDLAEALAGKAEALRPEVLTFSSVCVSINYQSFAKPFTYDGQRYDLSGKSSAEQTEILLKLADAVTGDMEYLPWIVRNGMPDADFEKILDAAYRHGCKTVFVSET